MDFSLIESAL